MYRYSVWPPTDPPGPGARAFSNGWAPTGKHPDSSGYLQKILALVPTLICVKLHKKSVGADIVTEDDVSEFLRIHHIGFTAYNELRENFVRPSGRYLIRAFAECPPGTNEQITAIIQSELGGTPEEEKFMFLIPTEVDPNALPLTDPVAQRMAEQSAKTRTVQKIIDILIVHKIRAVVTTLKTES